MLCQNIQTEQGKLTINIACSLLNTSRHAYNNWLQPTQTEKDPLYKPIQAIKKESRRYGYRRVTKELHRQGIKVNHKKVLKTMRKHGFLCKKHTFRICTTDSNHGLRTYPNLMKNIVVVKLNQAWASDITYVRFANNETAYLATTLDRFSRKCIGWQLSRNIDTQLCLDALDLALEDRKGINLTGLIHHSDQGSQYASNEYVTKLEAHGIQISMSNKGNPYENAHAESFFKTVKYEEIYMDEYQSFEDAYQNIKHFIEEVYNKKRLHSAIGYMPPAEFEQQYVLKEVVA